MIFVYLLFQLLLMPAYFSTLTLMILTSVVTMGIVAIFHWFSKRLGNLISIILGILILVFWLWIAIYFFA